MIKVAVLLMFTGLLLSAQSPMPKALMEGNPASSVRVLIYEDLQCPDCADFRKMLDTQLLPKYKGTVAFEHRDFPLLKHAWARQAAIASRYFETVSPELAVDFRKATMAAQSKILPENFYTHLADFAATHKVDPAAAVMALENPALQARVEADYQEGVARGIARTPTVLVNGHPFIETFSAAAIIKAIDQELKAAK